MKKNLVFFLTFLFAFQLFAEKINMNWVKKDESILSLTLNFIEENNFSDRRIKEFMKSNRKSIDSEKLGFGLQKFYSGLYGGYISIFLNYISYNDEPCKFTIYIDDYDFHKIEKKLDKNILQRLMNTFEVEEYFVKTNSYSGNIKKFKYVVENPENYEKYSKNKEKLIGNFEKVEIPDKYKKYYDYLNSTNAKIRYGYIFGSAGEKPYGREAMEKLLELNDKKIFKNLLKGDNPGGRIYAAEGLLRLENSQENVDTINKVFEPLIKEEIEFDSCEGCLVFIEKYDYYKFDKNQTFPRIEEFYPLVYDENSDFEL